MANVSISINSKFSDKGIKDANSSLKTLSNTVKGVSKLMGGFTAVKVFKSIKKEISECTKAYEDNLKEITKQTGAFTLYQKKIEDFDNTTKRMKNVFGEMFGNIKAEAFAKIQPYLDDITDWFTDNKDTIAGFFIGIPDIAKRTFQLVKDMLSFTFSMDFWGKYGKNVADILITAFKGIFETLWSIVQAIGTTIWEPLKTGFLIIGDTIQDTWYKVTEWIKTGLTNVINGIIKLLNVPIKVINTLMGTSHKVVEDMSNKPGIDPSVGREKRGVDGDKMFDGWKNVTSTWKKGIDSVVNSVEKNGPALKEAFDPIISEFTNDVNKIIKKGAAGAANNRNVVEIRETEKKKEKEKKKTSSGNIPDIKSEIIKQIIEPFLKLENVGKVINTIVSIFTRVADVAGPIINSMLAPLVIIFEQLGDILAVVLLPILNLINRLLSPILDITITILDICLPIITMLMKFVDLLLQLTPILDIVIFAVQVLGEIFKWLYTYIIKPVVNFIIDIVVGFVNVLIGIWNVIRGIIKTITLGALDIGSKDTVDPNKYKLGDLEDSRKADDSRDAGLHNTNSNTASYTAAKDIIVNINFSNSYVNGDAREISLMLRDEIRAAESLGR